MLIAGLLFEARDGRSRFLVAPGQRVIVDGEQIRRPTPIGPGARLRLTSDVDYDARIFEALSGERPFPTDTAQQNMLAKARGLPPAWPPQWPEELRGWIQSMIAVKSSDRFTARSALGAVQDERSTTTISDPTQSP